MKKEELSQAAEMFGTPLYVFELKELKETAGRIRAALPDKTQLCFAMKANPFLVTEMAGLVERIEVCSMGEFRICRELGIDPSRLFISGVLKKEEDLEEILQACTEQSVYTVESPAQYQLYASWSRAHHKTLRLYLRLTSQNQFGMDEETVRTLVRDGSAQPYLKIAGLHYFSGTQKRSVRKAEQELMYLDHFLTELEETYACRIEELEYGPGTLFPYFADQKDTRQEDLKQISLYLSGMRWKGRVTLEMGRAFAASCGFYLTRVRDVKQSAGQRYCIVDGGIHQIHYDGQIKGMYRPDAALLKDGKGEEEEWTICGSLCTVNDVLVQRLLLKNPCPGDVLVFRNTGAYAVTEGMALFLSHELPAVVLYSEKQGWKQIRREQQTYEWNLRKEIY